MEKLNSSIFEETNLDDLLDLRDEEAFVGEWVRVNHLIDQKKKRGFSKEEEALVTQNQESAYKKVYELCKDSEAAACLSDDFGLICESQLTGVTDPWLIELIKRYEASQIPCGDLRGLCNVKGQPVPLNSLFQKDADSGGSIKSQIRK